MTRKALITLFLSLFGLVICIPVGPLYADLAKPQWVNVTIIGGNKVGLVWNSVEGATGYEVLRSAGDRQSFQQITVAAVPRFMDTDVSPGEVYYYRLKARDDQGTVSQESDERMVTIPGTKVEKFMAPTRLRGRAEPDMVRLAWTNPGNAAVIAYNIYRSETAGSGAALIGSVSEDKYVDAKNLEEDKTYYYSVTALNENFEESPRSEEIAVLIPKSASTIKHEELAALPPVLKYIKDIKPPAEIKLNKPSDVAVGKNGEIYILDTLNHQIKVLNDNGNHIRTLGSTEGSNPGQFKAPMAIDIMKDGNLAVADSSNYRYQIIKPNGDVVLVNDFKGLTKDDEKKIRPIGIAADDKNNIYISDADNNAVRAFDSKGKQILKFGEYGPDDGQFCVPVGLWLDKDNHLYVADMNNNRVQIFDSKGNFINKFGQAGDTEGNFGKIKDLAVDEFNRIYVSDAAQMVIQVFAPDYSFRSKIGVEEDVSLQFAYPFGMTCTKDKLYITDRFLDLVRVYEILPEVTE